MAYKKLIKVSNVCQILDKSKYPATKTIDGVTFTNNGDGSWTISGKSTSGFTYYNLVHNLQLNQGHTYLSTYVLGNAYIENKFINKNNVIAWGADRYTADENSKVDVGLIALDTFNGADTVLIPQIFDLTEMYGAGHEPTTVEQFRQDFPEEMYDYSPYCWLTSYKRVIVTGDGTYPVLTAYRRNLTCKTKNLFDMNSYLQLTNSNIIINCNSIFCVATNKNASVSYKIPTVIGEKYTVSNKSVVRGGWVNTGNFGLFLSDNPNLDNSSYLVDGLQSGQSFTLTATSEFLYIHWYVCYNFDSNNPSTIEINELQVNLGDTATDYVPYGHL